MIPCPDIVQEEHSMKLVRSIIAISKRIAKKSAFTCDDQQNVGKWSELSISTYRRVAKEGASPLPEHLRSSHPNCPHTE